MLKQFPMFAFVGSDPLYEFLLLQVCHISLNSFSVYIQFLREKFCVYCDIIYAPPTISSIIIHCLSVSYSATFTATFFWVVSFLRSPFSSSVVLRNLSISWRKCSICNCVMRSTKMLMSSLFLCQQEPGYMLSCPLWVLSLATGRIPFVTNSSANGWYVHCHLPMDEWSPVRSEPQNWVRIEHISLFCLSICDVYSVL